MFTATQERLKDLIDGIKGEDDDNTKLSESLRLENAVNSAEPL